MIDFNPVPTNADAPICFNCAFTSNVTDSNRNRDASIPLSYDPFSNTICSGEMNGSLTGHSICSIDDATHKRFWAWLVLVNVKWHITDPDSTDFRRQKLP
jgi:hypothetical protein